VHGWSFILYELFKKTVNNLIYSQGKTEITCIATGTCKEKIPHSSFEKALSQTEIEKMYQRIQQIQIAQAKLEDLECCPFCEFKAIVPPQQEEFKCLFPSCGAIICRKCRLKIHPEITCAEAKKRDEEKKKQNGQNQIWNEMSKAVISRCPLCNSAYQPEPGCCNKVTCSTCKTFICCICNIIIEDNYYHFCEHTRQDYVDIKKCPKCNKCCLWTNKEELDFH